MPAEKPDPVIVAAHPDDETIGCGGHLARWPGAVVVHATDGAPRDLVDAQAHGFRTREEYAGARRRELETALSLAGIEPERTRQLDFADKELSLALAEAARRLADLLASLGCGLVLTHPYEGGHPDHDATAFAVHAACHLLEARGLSAPQVREFTSYHARNGGIEVGEFLPAPSAEVTSIELPPAERERKRRMLACFRTQAETLAMFGAPVVERFRPAPHYDFNSPAAADILYDRFDWGTDSRAWLEHAQCALATLGLPGKL